ncbi:MAG: NAD-dependent epimerase/dehydratase family protein [bacterium JZ-2024 1]
MNFWEGKRVLITGGAGFIGSNLALRLCSLNARVCVLDNFHPWYGANEFNLEPVKEKITLIRGDIRDMATLAEACREKDVIYHLAAQVSHLDSMTDPFYDMEVNVKGTLNLLEATRKFSPEAFFVYGGTRGQYGKIFSRPVKEDHPLFPLDIYGVHKTTGELLSLVYHSSFGLKTCSLRINNTFGPRHQMKHPRYGVLNYFIRLALDNQTISVFGDGSQLREYNYVDDVVDALLLVVENPVSIGKVYNLGSGSPMRFLDMVRKIIQTCGSGSYQLLPWPEERKRIEVGDFFADFSLIQKELGWTPRTPFEEGLRKTIDFYRSFRSHYW